MLTISLMYKKTVPDLVLTFGVHHILIIRVWSSYCQFRNIENGNISSFATNLVRYPLYHKVATYARVFLLWNRILFLGQGITQVYTFGFLCYSLSCF